MRAPVAQGIEQRTSNPLVGGSNPPRRTIFFMKLMRPKALYIKGFRVGKLIAQAFNIVIRVLDATLLNLKIIRNR